MLTGATLTEAAKSAGVGRGTLSQWTNHDPAFIAEHRNRKLELWEATRDELVAVQREFLQAKRKGVQLLVELADSAEVSAGDRVKAAKALADLPLPVSEEPPARRCTPDDVERELARREQQRVCDHASSLQRDAMLSSFQAPPELMRQAAAELGVAFPSVG